MGALFPSVVAVVLAAAFMLYLVPQRRGAAIAILAAACLVGLVLLWAVYGFHIWALGNGFRQQALFAVTFKFPPPAVYLASLALLGPGLLLATAAALITYLVWPRTRFFGTSAPLITAIVMILLALAVPVGPLFSWPLLASLFLIVFAGGVAADLLEPRRAKPVLGITLGILALQALFCLGTLFLHVRAE